FDRRHHCIDHNRFRCPSQNADPAKLWTPAPLARASLCAAERQILTKGATDGRHPSGSRVARRRSTVGTPFGTCAGAIGPAIVGGRRAALALAVFVTTLHPDVMGRRFLWQAESGVTVSNALHSLVEQDDYRKSPFTTVYRSRKRLRRRFADPDCPA